MQVFFVAELPGISSGGRSLEQVPPCRELVETIYVVFAPGKGTGIKGLLIYSTFAAKRPGRPTHHPRVMCGAILYGLIRGMDSTRKLEYATRYCLDFQWLLDGRTIDHSTFAKFRTLHGERIKSLFRQINRKAAQIKKMSLEEVIIDGTRVRADSDRLGARAAAALERRLATLEEKIAVALEQLEKAREEGGEEEAARCEQEKQTLEARRKNDRTPALALARVAATFDLPKRHANILLRLRPYVRPFFLQAA